MDFRATLIFCVVEPDVYGAGGEPGNKSLVTSPCAVPFFIFRFSVSPPTAALPSRQCRGCPCSRSHPGCAARWKQTWPHPTSPPRASYRRLFRYARFQLSARSTRAQTATANATVLWLTLQACRGSWLPAPLCAFSFFRGEARKERGKRTKGPAASSKGITRRQRSGSWMPVSFVSDAHFCRCCFGQIVDYC